ncbi:MAG: nitrate reductase subunit alpha [Conexivisphaerales archaeon]
MVGSQLRKIPQFFKKSRPNREGWSAISPRDRLWEEAYRMRWQHDKIVRSTHGVNCTGSCSWQIYVKDGIITWETQQTDYPTNGPSMPEYEPRGCPRGASFSWYVYSPLRIRYPYVRGILWRLWKEALSQNAGDEVKAWKSIVEDPAKQNLYKSARGMGGFIRADTEEIYRLISASLIYTIQKYGPDRIFGFTPIPAMSMVSYASGSRFISLLGGGIISFYDWYCDLPTASPEIWGEQTDVPESADWYNSSYIIMWGANLPITRTPDAHFMVEARYKGTKIVAVSPDYTDNVKFGDIWLPVRAGTDGALALAMTHVILKEFYVDRNVQYFEEYASTYTDLPFLVILEKVEYEDKDKELYTPSNFLTASDLGLKTANPDWKTVLFDSLTGMPVVPNGSIGFRWSEEGKWNLELSSEGKKIKPMLTLLGNEDKILPVAFPYFEEGVDGSVLTRELPAKVIRADNKEYFVTTVFDLLLASIGISRGLKGDYPSDYNDPKPYTPAWQEAITGVKRDTATQIAREFAKNAEITHGRSMIIMGSGINHWYHNDQIYRAILSLVLLTGAQGVNGGGWAHYVGQEKVRPLEGWSTVAFANDWSRPARLQNGTSFFYIATDQWRYEYQTAKIISSPLAGKYGALHFADYNVLAAKLGWLPCYPQFNKNPIELVREAENNGSKDEQQIVNFIAEKLAKKELKFAIEDPDEPVNFPRILFVWRANLISASGKGHEYFLKHLLGTKNAVMGKELLVKPSLITLRDTPRGKLDLLVDINFRMDGTALYSDIVLPAATWYEKHDISTTDLHPFIHPFNPAIDPAWESKSDWDTFAGISKVFSEMARRYFTSPVKDLVTVPLMHDSPDEIAQPRGRIEEWWEKAEKPQPGKNTQRMKIVERDYSAIYKKMLSLGPLITQLGMGAKGITFNPGEEYDALKQELGENIWQGHPDISTAVKAAEAIMALSGATNGSVAMKGWKALEKKTGVKLTDLAEEESGLRIRFDDLVRQPRRVMTTPVWSGIEKGGRQYTAFAVNVERKVPWRTLTGRQHFYLDHQLIREFGENLPIYRPPLLPEPLLNGEMPEISKDMDKDKVLRVRWITPHNKWSIHTTYSDNLRMLNLFRGGPTVWLNNEDASDAGIADNDWVEVFNRNGVMVARAVISHRIPKGTAFSYHAQDRTINVPFSTITKERGGIHNSVTQIRVKPTHMIGAYAQFSYGFNYWGPVGNQRDTIVYIRKMQEVNWAER